MIGRNSSDASRSIALRERRSKPDACQDGAVGGDAVLRDQQQELGKEHVDVGGGIEFSEVAGEGRAEVARIGLPGMKLGVAEAQAGGGIRLG